MTHFDHQLLHQCYLFYGCLKEDTKGKICDRYLLWWKINFYAKQFVFVTVGVAQDFSSCGWPESDKNLDFFLHMNNHFHKVCNWDYFSLKIQGWDLFNFLSHRPGQLWSSLRAIGLHSIPCFIFSHITLKSSNCMFGQKQVTKQLKLKKKIEL